MSLVKLLLKIVHNGLIVVLTKCFRSLTDSPLQSQDVLESSALTTERQLIIRLSYVHVLSIFFDFSIFTHYCRT